MAEGRKNYEWISLKPSISTKIRFHGREQKAASRSAQSPVWFHDQNMKNYKSNRKADENSNIISAF